MLRKFFISVLGTVAGLWISAALVILTVIILAGAIFGSSLTESSVKIEKKSILCFNLQGAIVERCQNPSYLTLLDMYRNGTSLSLEDMLLSLRAAADDDRIKALYLNCNGAMMGAASRQELIEEINNFKLSGKPVVAYADSYTQGDYLIATTADSIFLNPMGAVDLHGLGGTVSFYKGALDKLGVKVQVFKVGTFKSAVEPFINTSLSDPARLQMQQYLDSIWVSMAGTIAEARNIPVDSIYSWAPKIQGADGPQVFVDNGMVTSLRYRRQVDDCLAEISGTDADDLRLISPSSYLTASGTFGVDDSEEHVAVYYAAGEISDSGSEGIVGPDVVDDIIALADDDNVRGLVLRVNSPGGSAFASEQIWEALQYFKSKDKPFYVSMGDYAASGGYYISCGADRIYADPTTVTGSIGVFGMVPDLSGLVTDKFGVTFSTVETNPNGAAPSLMQPFTPAQQAAMQRSVEYIYDKFTGRVAEGRHMPQDSVKSIAEGRVWIATRALQLGLVDEIGSLDRATAVMLDELGMAADEVVRYPAIASDKWEQLLMEYAGIGDIRLIKSIDKETLETLYFINRLRTMNPVQARMETVRIE